MKPRLFIASSREHVDIAYAAQEGLEHDAEVTVWSQGVFQLSRSSMASLLDQLDDSDFGVFILAPDDVLTIRDEPQSAVRDNVVFELGLFVGRLGPDRCFMIVPHGAEDLHLPSDLAGLTPVGFDPERQDGNTVAALGPACNRIRKSITKHGALAPAHPATPDEPTVADSQAALCSDENDCISLIQSWMGSRPSSDNKHAIRYDDVDRELRLAPGSARLYIEAGAARWGYQASRKGKDTILFEEAPSRGGHYY